MCRGRARRTIGGMPATRPRRTLLIVALFVVLAGVIGGPVAGALDSSGGFVAPGADSEVAVERIQAATGRDPGAGIVLLVESPADAGDVEQRLAALPGVAAADSPRPGLVTAQLVASAEEEDVVRSYGLGANSFVRKPVAYDEFLEAIRTLAVYWLLVNEPPPGDAKAA